MITFLPLEKISVVLFATLAARRLRNDAVHVVMYFIAVWSVNVVIGLRIRKFAVGLCVQSGK